MTDKDAAATDKASGEESDTAIGGTEYKGEAFRGYLHKDAQPAPDAGETGEDKPPAETPAPNPDPEAPGAAPKRPEDAGGSDAPTAPRRRT